MITSQITSPFEVVAGEKISRGTLSYVCTRARQWAYNLLVSEFKKSGISQAELGRRLEKSPEVVSRMFGRPGNLEIDTLSAAIFAITGGIITFSVRMPANHVAAQPAISEIPPVTATTRNTPNAFPVQWINFDHNARTGTKKSPERIAA